MQIHELTKRNITEASIADRIAASNVAAGTARQQEIQAQAAQYAAKLRAQGYTGKSTIAPLAGPQTITAAIGNTTGEYTKTGQTWTNELDQRITDPNSIAYLDSILADQNKTATSQAGAVQPTQAGAVQTGGAGAVMTSVDVDQAIRQLGLSQEQLRAFQAQATQNPGFVLAFLKRLGLAR
jgi:hypothetical protein